MCLQFREWLFDGLAELFSTFRDLDMGHATILGGPVSVDESVLVQAVDQRRDPRNNLNIHSAISPQVNGRCAGPKRQMDVWCHPLSGSVQKS